MARGLGCHAAGVAQERRFLWDARSSPVARVLFLFFCVFVGFLWALAQGNLLGGLFLFRGMYVLVGDEGVYDDFGLCGFL